MNRSLLLGLLMLAIGAVLPGCAAVDVLTRPIPSVTGTTSEGDVYALGETYKVVLKGMDTYVDLVRCGAPTSPKLCSQQKVADQMVLADQAFKKNFDEAEKTVRTTPDVSAFTAYSLAMAAVNTIKDLLAAYAK